jgi:hypothetical protein
MKTTDANWVQDHTIPTPPPVVGGSFLFHPQSHSLISVGGINLLSQKANGLWTQNKMAWQPSKMAEVPDNRGMCATFDLDRKRLWLFGGIDKNNQMTNDIWAFDGNKWIRNNKSASPTARMNGCLAYDEARKVSFLFGGITRTDHGPEELNDCWIWDGQNWSQQMPSSLPHSRTAASMGYDPIRKNMLLFGGVSGGGYLDETWIWDGTSWLQQQPFHHPTARAYAGIVYNPIYQHILLFGGSSFDNRTDDTWIWDGADWIQIQTQNAPYFADCVRPKLVFDSLSNKITLFTIVQNKTDRPEDFSATSEVWTLDY